ncbi:protein BONZAI 3-like [Triticum aestivum]|uniref:protein BONZAI 3-like n=1 Tax=Triticum aestivum TaxID=4565 RepID=UPI001D029E83|nr:protein BONZAI 3-like [Triticum aestivum]
MDWCGGSVGTMVVRGPAASGKSQCWVNSRALHGLYTPLELSFSASKLGNADTPFETNAILVVYTKVNEDLEEIGRTEVILNSLEPLWVTRTIINYRFAVVQPLTFRIYDIAKKHLNTPVKMLCWGDQYFLGEAICSLSEVLTRPNRSLKLNLRNDYGAPLHSTLTVHAQENVSSRMAVEMTFHCLNLYNKGTDSKSDPFLRISRLSESPTAIPLCETEVVDNSLKPVWRPMALTSQQYGSKDTPLLVECLDFDANGNHRIIGTLHTTVSELETLYKSKAGADLYSHKGQRKLLKRKKGKLFLDNFQEKVKYTFLDYISYGFELKFMVAIDFTANNGNPGSQWSWHYIDPSGSLNLYQQAIQGVGKVLRSYGNGSKIQALGFGASIQGHHLSRCFNLVSEELTGVAEAFAAYESTLKLVSLAGPTMFGPVINKAAEIVSHSVENGSKTYSVLLIITAGEFTDKQETVDSTVRASELPLSIIIVGIGDADFTGMKMLEAGYGKRLESSTGHVASRNIVQFARMKKNGGQKVLQGLLDKLPGQLVEYISCPRLVDCHTLDKLGLAIGKTERCFAANHLGVFGSKLL